MPETVDVLGLVGAELGPPDEIRPGYIVTSTSPDDWAACDACHELILDGDKRGLVLRAVAFFFDERPDR